MTLEANPGTMKEEEPRIAVQKLSTPEVQGVDNLRINVAEKGDGRKWFRGQGLADPRSAEEEANNAVGVTPEF